ncbi:hypothetical protein Tco_0998232 [Tanacetum coccineum]
MMFRIKLKLIISWLKDCKEELTDEEKARLFVQFLEQRRKHFAAKRAKEQKRRGTNHQPKLNKEKSYRVNTFVDFRTNLVKGSSKRAGDELEQEVTKKQKVDDDQETTKIKELMKNIYDEEEVAIDAIPLATKPLSIMYLVFSHMLKSFDREDFETLWKLVKAKYGSTRPVEDLDLILYGDLKTMFEPHVEDQVWKNQQDYKVLDWKLYDSCGVHSLRMQHMHIQMLVEKRYPLTPATITNMLNKKL